jgi:rhamnose transport system permease protein
LFVNGGAVLPHFLDPDNLLDGTSTSARKALIALPMALLIICREIDISVAGTLALCSVAMGLAMTPACRPRRCCWWRWPPAPPAAA